MSVYIFVANIFEYSNIFATLWFTSMDRSAHPFIHPCNRNLLLWAQAKYNWRHNSGSSSEEQSFWDGDKRYRSPGEERTRWASKNGFTNSPIHLPTHLLTQSPIHQFTPPHLTNHPFLTWLQLYSYSKCPPPSLILIVIKLQIFVHTDDVCGQGTQCDGQHWRQGFENWCESFCLNISIVQTLRVHVPPLSPHSLNHHHCHYNADDGQVRNQQRREQLRGKQDAAEEEDYTTFLQQVLFVILIVMMIVILMVMMMMIIIIVIQLKRTNHIPHCDQD